MAYQLLLVALIRLFRTRFCLLLLHVALSQYKKYWYDFVVSFGRARFLKV